MRLDLPTALSPRQMSFILSSARIPGLQESAGALPVLECARCHQIWLSWSQPEAWCHKSFLELQEMAGTWVLGPGSWEPSKSRLGWGQRPVADEVGCSLHFPSPTGKVSLCTGLLQPGWNYGDNSNLSSLPSLMHLFLFMCVTQVLSSLAWNP